MCIHRWREIWREKKTYLYYYVEQFPDHFMIFSIRCKNSNDCESQENSFSLGRWEKRDRKLRSFANIHHNLQLIWSGEKSKINTVKLSSRCWKRIRHCKKIDVPMKITDRKFSLNKTQQVTEGQKKQLKSSSQILFV